MKNKAKKTLSAQCLMRIQNIFENNNWAIECSEGSDTSHFNRFCKRVLDIGENRKRDLFLELAERYLWIKQEQYMDLLMKTMEKLVLNEEKVREADKLYVMPLISPEDREKVKSSSMLTYMFNDVVFRYGAFSKYKIELLCNISEVGKKLLEDKVVLLLVDDFIGTGETAEKCLFSLNVEDTLYHKIKIVSLVAQEEGMQRMLKYGVSVVAYIERNKGISDYYSSDVVSAKVEIMEQIENGMSVKGEFRMGYGKSEALVTMCRTPNNTFPVFWDESGNMKSAPFPRY